MEVKAWHKTDCMALSQSKNTFKRMFPSPYFQFVDWANCHSLIIFTRLMQNDISMMDNQWIFAMKISPNFAKMQILSKASQKIEKMVTFLQMASGIKWTGTF